MSNLKYIVPLGGVLLTAALFVQARSTPSAPWSTSASATTASSPSPDSAAAAAAAAERVVAEGRVMTYPDGEVIVGTERTGTIIGLPAFELASVRKGELVAELRGDDLRAEQAEAEARTAEADADIRYYRQQVDRMNQAVSTNAVSADELDKSTQGLDAARARRAGAEATVARLAAEIDKTRILAPIDGTVIARPVQTGQTVEAGATLLTIADTSRRRIEAEVDEYDAGRVRVGDAVAVTAEGFPGRSWRGTVEEVPATVVGRQIRPEDPSKPTDTRVLLVKVRLDEPTPLKLRQRVEVTISQARE